MIYKKGNKLLKIDTDEDPSCPRGWSNLGKMICFHKSYDLGDKHELNSNEFGGWDEMEKYLIKKMKAEIIFPLYLFDHSGITMSISPFNCPWDSGQVGFIYTTKEDIREFFNSKVVSKKLLKLSNERLKGEVKTYNQYLTGDIYGFELYENKICSLCKTEEREILNSCSGFYGTNWSENGLLEEAGITDLNEWEEVE